MRKKETKTNREYLESILIFDIFTFRIKPSGKYRMNKNVKLEKWRIAQKRHRLSDKHTQMARELGLNPDKLGKIDNHRQESWKVPLPQFIENIYFKRFKKETPDVVKSIAQLLEDEKIKKEKVKKEKERKKKEKTREVPPLAGNNENRTVIETAKPVTLSARLKLYHGRPKVRVKLEQGDTPETILQKEAHIFDDAFDLYEKENVTLPELGFVLKQIHFQYKPRRYGCKTLGAIYEKLDKYEVIKSEDQKTDIVTRKRSDCNLL